jgi:hypothetical protein
MSSESELIKALSEMVVTEDPPIEYRLHYNEQGDVYMCSMQQHPDNDKFIVVTREQYDLYFRYRVDHGKLTLIEHDMGIKKPFKLSDRGFKTVKNHPALILLPDETYRETEYYDHRNN